jgi:hypothetical protein
VGTCGRDASTSFHLAFLDLGSNFEVTLRALVMPNQLLLDLKTTSPVPIQAALGDYIRSHYTDVHPDAFNWDVKHWEALRADASKDTIQHARVDVLLRCVMPVLPFDYVL